jgi:hypothetical protein
MEAGNPTATTPRPRYTKQELEATRRRLMKVRLQKRLDDGLTKEAKLRTELGG